MQLENLLKEIVDILQNQSIPGSLNDLTRLLGAIKSLEFTAHDENLK